MNEEEPLERAALPFQTCWMGYLLSVKRLAIGQNEIIFHALRDLPYFQPTTNYYCLSATSQDVQVSKVILLRDVSSAPDSYQRFYLTGTTGTESLNNAIVSLRPYGQWYATLFPSTGATTNDVDATQPLWNGIILSSE